MSEIHIKCIKQTLRVDLSKYYKDSEKNVFEVTDRNVKLNFLFYGEHSTLIIIENSQQKIFICSLNLIHGCLIVRKWLPMRYIYVHRWIISLSQIR